MTEWIVKQTPGVPDEACAGYEGRRPGGMRRHTAAKGT